MQLVLILYVIFAPLSIVGIAVAGFRVELALLFASVIALMWLLAFLSGHVGIRRSDNWSIWFWLFIGSSSISLVMSPYFPDSFARGVIQLLGVATVLVAALCMSGHVAAKPARLVRFFRILMWVIVVMAGISVWQFIALNVLSKSGLGFSRFLTDFSFLNNTLLGESVWRNPGYIGQLHRVGSISAEASEFVRTLAMVAGVVLLRLGLMGRSFSAPVTKIVPRWVALLIMVGFLVAISIIGYTLVILVAASIIVLVYRFNLRSFLQAAGAGVIVTGFAWFLFAWPGLGVELANKLSTVSLIFTALMQHVYFLDYSVANYSSSALTIAANLSIALENLRSYPFLGVGPGGHPFSYDLFAPSWVDILPALNGMNKLDAASLLTRLLSETGLIGTILFLSGWFAVVVRARQAIRNALTFYTERSSSFPPVLVVAIGTTASCLALFIMYLLRTGLYFAPSIWLLIALTAAVPLLLSKELRSAAKEHYTGELPSRKETSARKRKLRRVSIRI